MFKRNILFLLLIFVIGFSLVTASVWQILRNERISQVVPTVDLPVNSNSEIPYPEIPRVSLEEAKAAFDSGAAVFFDARGPSSYAEGHIPGAIFIPEEELPNRLSELDGNAWIVTYCT